MVNVKAKKKDIDHVYTKKKKKTEIKLGSVTVAGCLLQTSAQGYIIGWNPQQLHVINNIAYLSKLPLTLF